MKINSEASIPSLPPSSATPDEVCYGPAFLLNELSFPPTQKGFLLTAKGPELPQNSEEGSMPTAPK